MHEGVLFNLQEQENGNDDNAESRIIMPGNESLN